MKKNESQKPRKNDVINASEIGQYQYCSVAWYLQRCGYQPKSEKINIGKIKHVNLGKKIEQTQQNVKKSLILSILGYLLLLLAIILFVFEVI